MLDKVFAQKTELPDTVTELPGSSIKLDEILSGGINIFLGVIAVAAFASLIYSGFIYITAGGDVAQTTKARKNILWALIAVVLALSSYAIIRVAADLPGFSEEVNQQTETQPGNNRVVPTTPPLIDDIIK